MKDEKKTKQEKKQNFCAIYTRVSTAENLEQEFTSLDAQRESAESYILSQKSEGWIALTEHYNDAGYTGANTDRPALQRLIQDIKDRKINCVVVYKVDRLSRSLLDFSQLLEFFEQHNVAFVSVTQNFNTNTSMGRLTLNILLSFAQFEREIISERTRDKMGAAKKKGKWIGGRPPLGYDLDRVNHKLVINPKEAKLVRKIFDLYLEKRSLLAVTIALNEQGFKTKSYITLQGRTFGGIKFKNTGIQLILKNIYYTGKVKYNGEIYPGEQERIISDETFQRAQEILIENRPERKITQNAKNIGLLSDILRCKNCNCSMYYAYAIKGKYKYHYYLCMNAQKRGYKSCPTRLINAQAIENKVIECLKNIINDKEKPNKILKILNKGPSKEKAITMEKLRDVIMVNSPLWGNFSLKEKRRMLMLIVKGMDYDSKNGVLGITLNENGLKFLCANIDFNQKDR